MKLKRSRNGSIVQLMQQAVKKTKIKGNTFVQMVIIFVKKKVELFSPGLNLYNQISILHRQNTVKMMDHCNTVRCTGLNHYKRIFSWIQFFQLFASFSGSTFLPNMHLRGEGLSFAFPGKVVNCKM